MTVSGFETPCYADDVETRDAPKKTLYTPGFEKMVCPEDDHHLEMFDASDGLRALHLSCCIWPFMAVVRVNSA